MKTAWEREDSEFMLVAATVRCLLPSDIRLSMSSKELTANCDNPSTYGPMWVGVLGGGWEGGRKGGNGGVDGGYEKE